MQCSWQKNSPIPLSMYLLLQFIRSIQVLGLGLKLGRGLLYQRSNQSNKPRIYGSAHLWPSQGPTGGGHSPRGHCTDQTLSLLSPLCHFQIAPESTLNCPFRPEASSSSSDKSERMQPWRPRRGCRGSFHHPEIGHQSILQVCFAGQNWLKNTHALGISYVELLCTLPHGVPLETLSPQGWGLRWNISGSPRFEGWVQKPSQHFRTKGEKIWKQWDQGLAGEQLVLEGKARLNGWRWWQEGAPRERHRGI